MNELRVSVHRTPASRLIAALPRRSVDLLLTDPPYRTVDRHGGGHLRRWFRGSLSWSEIARLLAVVRRRLTLSGIVMVLVNEAGLPHAQAAIRRAGFARQRLIVWDAKVPGLGTGLRHQVAYVVAGLQPRSRTLTGRDLIGAAAVAPRARNRYPTEKPVDLGRQLAAIAGVRRGDTVVDPFCGSGNVLIGAAERGATVIAGDTSARAVRMAKERLSAAAAKRRRPSLDPPQIFGTRRSSAPSRSRRTKRPTVARPARKRR